MKKRFREVNFRPASSVLIEKIETILNDYQSQGFCLTLRQLFYQLVSDAILPNTPKSYRALSSLVTDARMAGLLDWDAIEDRVRQPDTPSEFQDLAHLVRAAVHAYRLPRWRGQENYVELWVEKDALAGVLRPIARKYHITLMVNRGYSSASAMYESARRIVEGMEDRQRGVVIYLGDHDPSGEDMVRDVESRLETFGVDFFEVRKLALTMDQIDKYKPPPNPAKVQDPRADAYIKKFGNSSWELDALRPTTLTKIIEKEILTLVDMDLMQEVIDEEDEDKKALVAATEKIMKRKK